MTKAEIVPTNFEMDYYAIWELLMTVISLVPLTTNYVADTLESILSDNLSNLYALDECFFFGKFYWITIILHT